MTTAAGTGVHGVAGDGGPATEAQVGWVRGIDVAADGSVYLSDTTNNRIRRIAPDGEITTVAGGGSATSVDGLEATMFRLGNRMGSPLRPTVASISPSSPAIVSGEWIRRAFSPPWRVRRPRFRRRRRAGHPGTAEHAVGPRPRARREPLHSRLAQSPRAQGKHRRHHHNGSGRRNLTVLRFRRRRPRHAGGPPSQWSCGWARRCPVHRGQRAGAHPARWARRHHHDRCGSWG